MRVRFWGTRGSVPTPGPTTVRYGGNTACVEVETKGGTTFIFDSGTGIRELGLHLAQQGGHVAAHVMLGHTHWDHISGFPFFTPAFVPGNRLVVYGARDLDRSLHDVLAGQMHHTYFPVPLGDLRADIAFVELGEGEVRIEDAIVRTHYLNHTAVCMGYRVEADGASVAYITDHEPYGDGLAQAGDRRLIEFVRGVDLLIQDAQYTPEEYFEHRGWGHGSIDYVTDVAVESGARRVALFHHEPTHTDDDVDRMVEAARGRARRAGSSIEIFAAAEGHVLTT
ncbi:MAG TPA: MBL fold metallo-hydrolase [Chloroflexota bacterium]|jgi:phosphoribosyl 1,2-cyclic phosphodiesterase|nr:MBL fold metallo-hydrolase [Chloroflexota bacterium]